MREYLILMSVTCPLPSRYGDEVLCRAGLEKLCIANEAFAEVDASAEYFIFGTLCNKLSGIRWDRVNALHCRIRFLDMQNEMLRFTSPDGIKEDEWEGLSGSPVFSSQGSLVGMVVRAVEGNNTLWVYPIHYILQIINFIESLP